MFNYRTQRLAGTSREHGTIKHSLHQQPANGEHLMAERAFGEAMKRDSVKRLQQQSESNMLQHASRGRLYAFGALPDYLHKYAAGFSQQFSYKSCTPELNPPLQSSA